MEKYVLEVTPQDCGHVFKEFGFVTTKTNVLYERPEDVSLVIFTGGHDVCPELYGENCLSCTFFSLYRDLYEGDIFEEAQKNNIPCVGICRGAQFLCVKAGGKLVQDIGGHFSSHRMRTWDDRSINVTSSHHQMQLPPEGAVVLGWSDRRLSNRYLNGDGKNLEVEKEIETVYYPNINALGVQSHPEWTSDDHELPKYVQEITRKYLFDQE